MLPERIYQKASTEFGVSVGIAKIMGFKKKSEHIEEFSSENYKQLSKELDVNWIITESILDGNYKELEKTIYKLKKTNPRLKSELSIYNRAFNIINGKEDINKTKSTKIHSKG